MSDEIKDAIHRYVKPLMPDQVVVGTIKSINVSTRTCEVFVEGRPDRTKVRMRAVIDNKEKGFLIKPTVGSYVLVGLIDNLKNQSFIIEYTEVDEILWIAPKIKLNGDQLGGLIKIEKLVERLNKFENSLAQFVAEFNAHTHTSPPAPVNPVLTAAPNAPSSVNAGTTLKTDLENKTVCHG